VKIDLAGHIAIVTGAAGELGRVIARTLGQCGVAVGVHYFRSAERANALLAEIRGCGARAEGFQADLTEPAQVTRLRDAVVAQLGPPDILINNAVSQYAWKTVLEQPVEDYVAQFRSSVLQNVLMAQAFVPAMIAKGWGRIIAINTECAMTCKPTESAYAAGKRGVDAIVRVLAKEIGPHQITVNEVAPGWMISERYRREGTERQPEYEKNVPLGHRGEDQDVANVVAFLASDLARFITGAYIPVCGGSVMPAI
jgi:3-oxoacyl-[acyl-carrier protein] reductase